MGRFVLLSGPSCVGKGPLLRALSKLYPETTEKLQKVVLYNGRERRPCEVDDVDYHFIKNIQGLPDSDYIKMEIRKGNWQALKLSDITSVVQSGKIGFLEVFHKLGALAKNHPVLNGLIESGDVCTVFLSPLSMEEIQLLKSKAADLPAVVADIMRRKLLRRTTRQKGILSLKDLEDIEKRCSTAYGELQSASDYRYVLVNHDGEDSDNWEQFPLPIGDAEKSVHTFAEILEGKQSIVYQQWPVGLLP
ncbi:hypothetical protein ACFL60_08840 [Candidatus Omnitrophota bacterium]